jgi:hypothetical protein
MELVPVRSLWGVSAPWETALPSIKGAGYAGIEYFVPQGDDLTRLQSLLAAHELAFVPLIFTRGDSVDDHLRSFREQCERSVSLAPVRANCHAGRDCWSRRQSSRFVREALAVGADLPFDVAFETHRSRIFYNPWTTRDLCVEFPEMQLTADFSHWVVVCERLLTTEADIVAECARRCIHIHTRVGYEEGPQVPDPRAPEYARHLEAHEAWWQQIWQAQAERGLDVLTFVPEYGPPPYQQTLPYTAAPVADIAAICDWMRQRQLERFQQWKGR